MNPSPASPNQPVLVFDDVHHAPQAEYDEAVRGVSFAVEPGELVLVLVEQAFSHLALADLAQGLVQPDEGRVWFEGRRWRDVSAETAAAMRRRIGRVFYGPAWLSNLNLDENITLAARQHGADPDEVLARAEELSRRLGLPGLPRERPAWCGRRTSMLAQWVRAMVEPRALLLLEHPDEALQDEQVERGMALLEEARAAGTAVVWITEQARIWNKRSIPASLRTKMINGTWVAGEADHHE